MVHPSHPLNSNRVELPAVICPFCPVVAVRSYIATEEVGAVPVCSTDVVEFSVYVAVNMERRIPNNIVMLLES
jgi:hypothetical protein